MVYTYGADKKKIFQVTKVACWYLARNKVKFATELKFVGDIKNFIVLVKAVARFFWGRMYDILLTYSNM